VGSKQRVARMSGQVKSARMQKSLADGSRGDGRGKCVGSILGGQVPVGKQVGGHLGGQAGKQAGW
jgi:hypothetical protein